MIDTMSFSPEEVLLAEHLSGPDEALVGQLGAAVGADEAGAVPAPVQHLQDEPVHDGLLAAAALGDCR